jgi:tetratricopeptide (TPR) repeat protein
MDPLNQIEIIQDPADKLIAIESLFVKDFLRYESKLCVIASECAFAVRKYEVCCEYAQRLISSNPCLAHGYLFLARSHQKLGNEATGVNAINLGLINCKDICDLLLVGCDLYHKLGNDEKALEYGRSVIENYPRNWLGYSKVVNILMSLDKCDEALDVILKGVQCIPKNYKMLLVASGFYRRIGDRKRCLEMGYHLVKYHPSHWSGFQIVLTNLLILEKLHEANDFLNNCINSYSRNDKEERISKFIRYLDQDSLLQDAVKHVLQTRNALHKLYQNDISSLPEIDINGFSDYILIANNPNLTFNRKDIDTIMGMKSPLFIYLNSGNAVFCQARSTFMHKDCKELLFGRRPCVNLTFSPNGELKFTPYSQANFLGCMFGKVINESDRKYYSSFSKQYPSIPICLLTNIFKMITDHYYPSSFVLNGKKVSRSPSMGWYAISLFDSLVTFRPSLFVDNVSELNPTFANLWIAGFSLSPSYIFEVTTSNLHDHVFERSALNYRIANNHLRELGTYNKYLTEKV